MAVMRMVGARVKRVEDPRLITGQSTYVDDVRLVDTLYGAFHRSPIAHGRITRIGPYRVDVQPRGTLLVLRNRDVPGVIGRVGTLLGDAGVNIAEYHQARLQAGGEALAAVSIDTRLSPETCAALSELPEIVDVRQVHLD